MGKLFWIIVIVLLIGGYSIVKLYGLDLEENSDRKTFITKFGSWVVKIGKNTFRTVGYAVGQDWKPEKPNETKLNASKSIYIYER